MRVMTKTCARDADRVSYQIEAFKRMGIEHLVLIDSFFASTDPAWATGPTELLKYDGGTTEVRTCFEKMPEAIAVRDGYLRQQYVKLMAPIAYGEDFFEVDSDMCPRVQNVKTNVGWREVSGAWFKHWLEDMEQSPTWYIGPVTPARAAAHALWRTAHRALFGEPGANYLFMGPARGWHITQAAVQAFVADACRGDLLAVFDRVERERLHFSEYQMLGAWLYDNASSMYAWAEGLVQPDWCHHFSSSTEFGHAQRATLERAAGRGL